MGGWIISSNTSRVLDLNAHHIPRAKTQYSRLKEVVLEVDIEAMTTLARKPPKSIFFSLLIPTDMRRLPLDFCMCFASTVPVICLEHLILFRLTTWFTHRFPSRCCLLSTFSTSTPNVPDMPRRNYPGPLSGQVGRHCSYRYVADGRLPQDGILEHSWSRDLYSSTRFRFKFQFLHP